MYDIPDSKPWLTVPKMIVIALLILLLAGAAFLVSVMYATPKVTVDYGKKAHELVRERQGMPADAPNEWEVFAQLGAKLDAAREAVMDRHPDARIEAFDFSLLIHPDAEPGRGIDRGIAEQLTREWLEEFRERGGFAELARLPQIPYAARPAQSGAAIDIVLPELGQVRTLVRLNAARMRLAAKAGDDAERLAAYEESLASARLIGAQQALIDHLVAVATHATVNGELRREIVERPLDASAARELLAAMDRHPLPGLAPVFDTERFYALDTIQRTFTDDGKGNGRYLPVAAANLGVGMVPGQADGLGTYRVFNVIGLFQPDRASTEAKTKEVYDHLAKLASLTRAERQALPGPDPLSGLERFKSLEIMVPAMSHVLGSHDQHVAETAATRIILALELHRSERGSYPASLAELVPTILAEIPLDATNGKPFGYRVLAPGADEHGRGYLVYSFASDGIDNGGQMGDRPPPTPKLSFGQTGVDFVYNQPRAKPKADPDNAPPTAAEEAAEPEAEITPAEGGGGE